MTSCGVEVGRYIIALLAFAGWAMADPAIAQSGCGPTPDAKRNVQPNERDWNVINHCLPIEVLVADPAGAPR